MPTERQGARPHAETLSERRARLHAALKILREPFGESPARVAALARWMNTWKRLGAIVTSMTAQGFDVALQQYPHGWWANFYCVFR